MCFVSKNTSPHHTLNNSLMYIIHKCINEVNLVLPRQFCNVIFINAAMKSMEGNRLVSQLKRLPVPNSNDVKAGILIN